MIKQISHIVGKTLFPFRHPKPEALQNAKQLAINLIQTIQAELQTYIQQQPPPVQPQQVIEQSQMQQSMYYIQNTIYL